MWASMDILVYMTILCEQLCVCVYVCMHIIRSSECFEVCGSGKVLHACTHRQTHTLIRFRKWCRPLSEGMGECVLSTAAINY